MIKRVAALRNESPWAVWESWAMRHAIPIYDILGIEQPRPLTAEDIGVLRARLRDILGYVILGLALAEESLP